MKNTSLDESKTIFTPTHNLFGHRNGYGGGGHGSEEKVESLHHSDRLADLLGLDDMAPVEEILAAGLLNPIAEVISNPGKRVRGQLVALCYRLASDESVPSIASMRKCRSFADTVEFIHAASLIVDDIEDGSSMRRGRPALHIQYGMPLALNAGNWLYFWPYEFLKDAGLPADQLLLLYEHCHRTLLRAHFGQAIDLGVCLNAIRRLLDGCLSGPYYGRNSMAFVGRFFARAQVSPGIFAEDLAKNAPRRSHGRQAGLNSAGKACLGLKIEGGRC
jgi:hypothetical protein